MAIEESTARWKQIREMERRREINTPGAKKGSALSVLAVNQCVCVCEMSLFFAGEVEIY